MITKVKVLLSELEAIMCIDCEHSKTIDATYFQPMEVTCPAEFNPLDGGCKKRREAIDKIIDAIIDNAEIVEGVQE